MVISIKYKVIGIRYLPLIKYPKDFTALFLTPNNLLPKTYYLKPAT